jgi:LysR family transcriptional regulator, cell division regulator
MLGATPKPDGFMDSADLKVFQAVARLGSMKRAADELNTVQSNVTARIRQLEQDLDVSLFERHSRGVELTDAGRRLLPYAQSMGHLLSDARRAVADAGEPSGALAIGSLETTAALRLPPILSRYAAAYPDVDLVLTTGTTCELVERVLARQLEGAFVCGPVNHAHLEEEVAFHEELVMVTARSVHGLNEALKRPGLKIVVLRAGCSYRQRLEALLARRGVVGLRRLEFGTIDGILGCVAAGLGITLLPRAIVAAASREGRVVLHKLPHDESEVETMFIRHRDAFVSSALDAFMHCARPSANAAHAAE